MNEFFDIKITSDTKEFVFSKADGSQTSLFILDDGWTPAVATYNNENVVEDVVEELYCMTNVASRDEALTLIQELSDVINFANKDIVKTLSYKVTFHVISQFSTSSVCYSYIVSPPEDNEIIQLSNELMTASPGQIKFKLRFKRKGFWVLDTNYNQKTIMLYADGYTFKGVWVGEDSLLNQITNPTPISVYTQFINNNSVDSVRIERLFMCFNIEHVFVLKNWSLDANNFNMTSISYDPTLHAQNNVGYLIKDTTEDSRPYIDVFLTSSKLGDYAVFVSWRSVQSNVAHKLQVQFNNNAETKPTVLLANDTNPKLSYLGTVTINSFANYAYLNTTIGDSNGFELEKVVLVKLKDFSRIVEISSIKNDPDATLAVENFLENSTSYVTFDGYLLPVYDNLHVVADTTTLKNCFIGHTPGKFSLTNTYSEHIDTLQNKVYYKNIRTIFK